MGLSTSKQTTTQNQNTTQTGTTTPSAPSWVTDSLQNYLGGIDAMSGADPNSFVAGASPLQQQAWANTDRLGAQSGNYNAASNIALNAANAPASTMPGAAGYNAAKGGVSTYSAAQLANPREASATGYNAAQADPASLLTGLSNYMNPYQDQVVKSTLADFDQNAGQTRAAQEAAAARTGAFGGSRYGIAQAATEGELARARAATEGGLLSQGFTTAAGLSQSDAANRQQASLFNAQNQTGAAAAGASALNNASLANQQASNQFALSQAGMNTDAAKYAADVNNANTQGYLGRQDAAAGQQAQATNATNLFNAQQQEAGLNRQLAASQQLGSLANDYGANTRADLGAMGALGDQQRQIEQSYALAPLAQLQAAGSLFGATPYQALVGQNVTGTGTMNGTATTKSSPSLFDQLMAGASLGMSFFNPGSLANPGG